MTDGVLAYAGFAYGYKSGGLNMSGLPLDAQNQPTLATAVIEDEKNSTIELGVKSTLLDGRATLNVTGYRTVVGNYQANVVSSLETAAIRSYPSNVPEVRVQGVLLHTDSSFRSGYNSDTSASQYTWISGYSVTNASVGYRFENGWEASVFARNLFDEDYITALTIQTGNSGLILGQPSDPRVVGVTLRARF